MPSIYLDNNATTAAAPEVIEAMLPWLRASPGNPSSLHAEGLRAAEALEQARASVARLIGAKSLSEIVFTSGGTESINTAIHAALRRDPARTKVVATEVEHAAVLRTLESWTRRGARSCLIPVDGVGRPDLDRLLVEIDERCALVSLQWANNETGVLALREDLEAVGAACREKGALLHLDAVQAVGKEHVDVSSLPVDMLSLSAHKLHGPKGVGALWVRAGVGPLEPLLSGGTQENRMRPGTQNVPGIVGLGAAAALARAWLAIDAAETGRRALRARRDRLELGLLERIEGARVHAASAPRLANTSSIAFPGIDGEAALMLLSESGVAVSSGAACSTGNQAPSHVLLGMGVPAEEAKGTLRLSLSRETTDAEVERTLELVPLAVATLRALAP